MKERLIFAAALVMAVLTAVLPALAEGTLVYSVPSGFDETEYGRLVTFLEQTDDNGVKNGEKLSEYYDPEDPFTWSEYGDDSEAGDRMVYFERINGVYKTDWVDFWGLELTGFLDLSGFDSLGTLMLQECGIEGYDIEGCTRLYALAANDVFTKKIHWKNVNKQLDISVDSEGCGSVSLYSSCDYADNWEESVTHWSVKAAADEGHEFVGWFDGSGGLVSEDAEYEFFSGAIGIMEGPCVAPSDFSLTLTARFTNDEPDPTDTPEPSEPPSETDAPEPSLEPTDPTVTDAPVKTDMPDPTETPSEGSGMSKTAVVVLIVLAAAAVVLLAAAAAAAVIILARKKR